MLSVCLVALGLLIIGIAILIYFTFKGDAKKRLVIKIINSSLFLIIGILALFGGHTNVQYDIMMMLGGAGSFLGDVLLGINFNKEKTIRNKSFIVGGFSFFFAQLCFAGAFVYAAGFKWYLIFLPFVCVIIAYYLMKKPKYNVIHGKLKVFALGYVGAVTLAFSCALGFVIDYGFSDILSIVSLGGLFFLISDLLLMYKYFFKRQYKTTNVIYMTTYYLAEAIYMLSIMFFK